VIVEAVLLLGAVLILVAAIGVVRFDDTLIRMHALTKATTLGLLIVLLGSAFALDHANDWTSVGLAAALQLLTSPVSAHLIGRATYRSGGLDHRLDVVDELAEAEGRAPLDRWAPPPDPAPG
jgi:multicomponent Na+:H+ antiporter subunit G